MLDIGCFDKWPKKHISEHCSYIGLDYYETATRWYGSVPDIYGDALNLPIKNGAVNTVLLLDVLEHISDTDGLLSGVDHVLSEKGQLIMSVPFLYPLHDEPRDFIRLTIHGFQELESKSGFVMEQCTPTGHPVETYFLLVNIAFSKTITGWVENKNPASILILFLPLLILFNNLPARFIRILCSEDHFMPHGYQLIFRKAAR